MFGKNLQMLTGCLRLVQHKANNFRTRIMRSRIIERRADIGESRRRVVFRRLRAVSGRVYRRNVAPIVEVCDAAVRMTF